VPDVEFEQVFRIANPLVQLGMLLARDAGLRHAAVMEICAGNCNFETHEITGRTKAGSSYTVPMTQRLYERLLFLCAGARSASEPLVCQCTNRSRAPGYTTLTTSLSSTKKRAGVERRWGFHDMRRTTARILYENTRDIRKVQGFLGHATPLQTWWYMGNAASGLRPEDVERASSAGRNTTWQPENPSSPGSDLQSQPSNKPQQKIA
jgi:integrase